jgi:uncharacterized membrane protein
MIWQGYRKRLERDLEGWLAAGLLQPAQAQAIRQSVAAQAGGVKLPAMLGLMGGLLIASGVIAFIAANWQAIPRLGKLGAILALILAALGVWRLFAARAQTLPAEAAATVAVLIYGAGVALVGQMYHLPADWPSGALYVGIGALLAGALLRSDGALMIAAIAGASWLIGLFEQGSGGPAWGYLAFWAVIAALAFGRANRMLQHLVVVAGGLWLVLAPAALFEQAPLASAIAYALFLGVVLTALGALALDRGWSAMLTACMPWGLLAYVLAASLQLLRLLEASFAPTGAALPPVVMAGAAALAALVGLLALARDKRSAVLLALALALAGLVPLLFWSGFGTAGLAGRVVVGAAILSSGAVMVLAGASTGLRRVSSAGVGVFGLAILTLLYRTIGTLLDQSLFFLVFGVALIALAFGARKVLARLAPRAEARPEMRR